MDAVQEVKGRLSVEDVVGEYVRLKRMGKNYKGLSPFTNEKTPSFVVSPEKQIWHDFSSGRGGDMFTFVQEVEGLDFKGALEMLARKAGVDLEQYQKASVGGKKLDKERLHEILALAGRFYQSQLRGKKEAYEYLANKRGFSKQAMLDFQLGYSPDNNRSLTDFLLKKGYSEKELKLVGLSVPRRGELGDMFRGRIMIPLHDGFGRIVGFTARLLIDREGAPKYINTPSTPLYDKSRHVFGLHLAKEAIRKSGHSVLAEGNLDVVSSHQAGIKQVVATAGTALTEQQLKILGRFSDDVRLAFDADRAGLEAAERAIPLASKTSISLGIITLPEGKDPDELIKKDAKLWEGAIKNCQYAMDWLIERYKEKLDLKSAQGKREFSDILAKVIEKIADPVELDHYVKEVARLVDAEPDSIRKKLASSKENAPVLKAKKAPKAVAANSGERAKAADRLLCLALMLPGTRGYLELLDIETMVSDAQKTVLEFLQKNLDFAGKLEEAPQLGDVLDYVKILSLQFEELYGEVDTLELQFEAARLRTRIIEHYTKERKTYLSSQLEGAGEKEQKEILTKVKELDSLLNKARNI
jgi:DNA primase